MPAGFETGAFFDFDTERFEAAERRAPGLAVPDRTFRDDAAALEPLTQAGLEFDLEIVGIGEALVAGGVVAFRTLRPALPYRLQQLVLIELLGDASPQRATGSLLPLLRDHAALLAPGLVMHVGRGGPLVDRAIVCVLGFAGAGYEVAISEQLASRDEQTVRAALRALARIGTSEAEAVLGIQPGPLETKESLLLPGVGP